MTDLFQISADMPHHVAHAKAIAPACTEVINQGYSMLTTFISSLVSAGIGFGLGWYIKGRGMTGVRNDLNNIKTDVENLKAKFTTAPAVAI